MAWDLPTLDTFENLSLNQYRPLAQDLPRVYSGLRAANLATAPGCRDG